MLCNLLCDTQYLTPKGTKEKNQIGSTSFILSTLVISLHKSRKKSILLTRHYSKVNLSCRIYCVNRRKTDLAPNSIIIKFQTTKRLRLSKISPSTENTVVTFNKYVFILRDADIRQNPLSSYVRSYSVVKDWCFEINKPLKFLLNKPVIIM